MSLQMYEINQTTAFVCTMSYRTFNVLSRSYDFEKIVTMMKATVHELKKKGLEKKKRRESGLTTQGHLVCDSGCWTPGQKEVSAACHTIRWSPQMPLQTPCDTATGIHWGEPEQNHL